MIVIADTSPVNYAALIGIADVFFDLYGQLTLPAAVFNELTSRGAPQAVCSWVNANRGRIDVRDVLAIGDLDLSRLHAGEAQTIFLAQNAPNALLIIDEKEGRAEARRRGIAVTGLLGVI